MPPQIRLHDDNLMNNTGWISYTLSREKRVLYSRDTCRGRNVQLCKALITIVCACAGTFYFFFPLSLSREEWRQPGWFRVGKSEKRSTTRIKGYKKERVTGFRTTWVAEERPRIDLRQRYAHTFCALFMHRKQWRKFSFPTPCPHPWNPRANHFYQSL